MGTIEDYYLNPDFSRLIVISYITFRNFNLIDIINMSNSLTLRESMEI